MRRRNKVLVATGALLTVLVGLRLAVAWLYGVPPHVWLASLVYDHVPRIEVPAPLSAAEPVTFPVRILEKRQYWLNLRVYFDGEAERATVSDRVGDPHSLPAKAQPRGTATEFRVVVRDRAGHIVHDKTQIANGRHDTMANSLGRRIDEFVLTKGLYDISVAPLAGISEFAAYRTALELTSHPKSSAMD